MVSAKQLYSAPLCCALYFSLKQWQLPPHSIHKLTAFPQQVQRPILFNLFTKDDSNLFISFYLKELTELKTKTVAVINPFVCVSKRCDKGRGH